MERFVFVAAVTIAIIWGAVAMFGHGRIIHFNGDWDIDADARMAPLVEVAPGNMAPQTFAGSALELKHVAANVVITPEDRTDFVIEIANPAGRAPMPEVTVDGSRVIVDGRLSRRISRCTEGGGADLRDYGAVSAEELPRITIRAPRTLNLERSGAGATEIGASEGLSLEVSGCSATRAADVAGALEVEIAGSGDVTVGAARTVNAEVAGSAGLQIGAVAEGAEIDIAGSGSVTMASLTGDLNADGAGSGRVAVHGGAISTAEIDLAGSGGVVIAAPVRILNVSIVGSGDVEVNGEVGDIEADIAGSGGVRARSVTGAIRKEVWGSGDVSVGG